MRAFLLFILLAGPAWAQGREPATEVQADLDRDGKREAYRIRDGREGMVDLVVAEGGRERVAPGVAWTGGMAGQQPELSVSPAGSVVLTSKNEGIGRDRWRLALTIAHRDGELRVAGITYDWTDTLDVQAGWGRCDLNLLSGRGEVETVAGRREVEVPFAAPLLWDWRDEAPAPWPEVCLEPGRAPGADQSGDSR
jgi:hypothetical protein